ncbi:MAG: HAMP domain-containing histidine kinase [Polyangiaceae bacterium]|nr:HAMP domain-containing histidine kinase [Polyangiaceae bacterium]
MSFPRLSTIETLVVRRAALADSLWDAARLDAGSFDVQPRNVSLGDLVRLWVEGMLPAAHARGVTRTAHIHESPVVFADDLRLAQAVTRLVSNAIDFTPCGGEIDVDVGVLDRRALLCVCDTGHGMTKAQLDRCFESPSQRADRSPLRDTLAIGLFVVRGIVELHQDSIRAFSAGQGCGSTITITLPAIPPGPISTSSRDNHE